MKWLFSTMKAELSIGALPSPTIRRAPSKSVAPGAGGCSDHTATRDTEIKRFEQEIKRPGDSF
jgi:hypothetical protein